MFDGTVCRLGIDAAHVDVQRQLDADALDVISGCFGNYVFHARDTRVSAVAGGPGRLLVLINKCAFPPAKRLTYRVDVSVPLPSMASQWRAPWLGDGEIGFLFC